MNQSRIDSLMESVTNIAVGYIISLSVWIWIVDPLFGFQSTPAENIMVTNIFTVTSLLRQYLLRRAFNGRSVWQAIRGGV